MNTEDTGRPGHPLRILSAAFTTAVAINLALLLLIGALISRRETEQASAPKPQPIDFIRIVPKAEEPEPTPKPVVDAAPEQPPEPERPAAEPAKPAAKPSPERPRRREAPKKAAEPKPTAPAPRIDIPEQGTGAPFAPVPGADSRLTAPPGQWNLEKIPEPGAEQEASGGAGGRNLVVLSRVEPRYPSRAAARGIEGWVEIDITVSPAGTVSDARVVAANPKNIFDRAALEAIRQWRFKPAFREGRAVEQKATQIVRFRLKKRR
jgi:protein TonB